MVVALVVAVGLTAIIGVASFVLSFNALRELVIAAGQPPKLADLFPLAVDGAILQATIGLVVIAERPGDRGRRQRRFFWTVLVIGSAVSIGLNALHALLNHSSGFNGALAAGLAAIAPVGLICAIHGLIILAAPGHTTISGSAAAAESAASADEPTPPAADHTDEADPATASPAAALEHDGTTEDAPAEQTVVEHAPAAEIPAGPMQVDHNNDPRPGGDDEAVATGGDARSRGRDLLDAGYHRDQIATMLGKHRATIYRWFPVDTDTDSAGQQLHLAG